MRKQIAAANWKMNLTFGEAKELLEKILSSDFSLQENQQVIIAVPAPYLQIAAEMTEGKEGISISAENIYPKKDGAYTGETSVDMLLSLGVKHTIIGHSERREYFNETNEFLKQKVDFCLQNAVTPIFCCGEALEVREENKQNEFVAKQIEESLFHLNSNELKRVVIAYEPIWAIGTGKTATSQQAQEIQQYIRQLIAEKYDQETADAISILYGGSVKAANAEELFSQPDIDGGLVGGASLVAEEFVAIIKALK